jgi:hypothetical protein
VPQQYRRASLHHEQALGMAANNDQNLPIHRQKVTGYKQIERCVKGDEVFYEVGLNRRKNYEVGICCLAGWLVAAQAQ